nr:hypothetical protein [Tanacetum cinerariifolium]
MVVRKRAMVIRFMLATVKRFMRSSFNISTPKYRIFIKFWDDPYIYAPVSKNRLAFYDDDDDEYSIKVIEKSPIAITPVLPTEKPENSLSILDNMCDVPFSDKNNFDAASDLIDSFLTQDTSIVYSPKIDTLLEEFASELTRIDLIPSRINETDSNPKDDIQFIDDHTKGTSGGSTTTHADNSLLEYDSFLFEIKPDQEPDDDVCRGYSSIGCLVSPFLSLVNMLKIAPDLEASRARGFVQRPLEFQSLAYGNPIS